MKKLKVITGLLNSKKTLLVSMKVSEEILRKLDEIIADFDNSEYFKFYLEEYNDVPKEIYNPKSPYLKNSTIRLFKDEETAFLIIREETLQMIILKNSSKFKELEKKLFSVFDFVPVKK
ncbi:MAG TPA: hypothetical protein VHA12_00515 [Candidatus Nanoarchaeia archaeon]|nr:hypothetical protein [Candidatus Nanoarchaeia archaeon]